MSNDPKTTIRLATVSDAEILAVLLDDFNNEFDSPTPGTEVHERRFRQLLATPTTFAIIAGEQPVGFALLTLRWTIWYDGCVALLDELYVKPELRDQGIGTALMAAVETECRQRSVESIEINVYGGDTDARRFYERHGYTATDHGDVEPNLYYSRDLN
jgi:GNAT superfamily N-acetyltransferase